MSVQDHCSVLATRRRLVSALWGSIIVCAAAHGQGTATLDDASQRCVDLINEKRASIGLSALARWREGEAQASLDARTDSATGTWHGSFIRRLRTGKPANVAQNECSNSDARPALMIHVCIGDMWAEGPENHDGRVHGHYLNMTSRTYSRVACGFALAPDGELWSVQNFSDAGTSSGAAAPAPHSPAARVAAPVPRDASLDAPGFNSLCLSRLNQYRTRLHLEPFATWSNGAACAEHLAQIYVRNGEPGSADQGCLGQSAWRLSVCVGDAAGARAALDQCLDGTWQQGRTNAPNDDYLSLANPGFHEAACGVAAAGDGSQGLVWVLR